MRQKSISTLLSNKLYHGEVSNAVEALECVVNGMNAEMEDERQWNAELAPDEQGFRWDSSDAMQQYRDAASQALSIWRDEMDAAKARVVARIRAQKTPESEQIAHAIEAEEWDTLAW